MPYRSSLDLPLQVQRHLPAAAQDIYRESFNHAWQTYQDDPRQEEIAHRVAWSAVKKRCRKQGNIWVARLESGGMRQARPHGQAGCSMTLAPSRKERS